jgi:lipopolysaccharide export system permease protein
MAIAAAAPGSSDGGGGMTLSLYVAKKFFWTVLAVFLIFFGIMMLIDIIEQLRKFSSTDISLSQAAYMALMNVPESLYRILPLIMIMAAIAMFLALARSSELVVVRAAGRSGLSFLVAPVVTALLIGAFAVAVLNPLAAATSKKYDVLFARQSQGQGSVLSVSDSGLWLRQGGVDGQTVVQAAHANSDGTELLGVTFLMFGADGLPTSRIEAEKAVLEPGAWVLTRAKRWTLLDTNPESSAMALENGLRVPSELTRDSIRDSFGTPSAIPFWDLPAYIDGLESAGFSARAYQVWLQMELAQPVLLAAMVLIAAGFTMRHARFGKTGSMVLYALLSGFGIFFLRNFTQVLGNTGQIPIALAAWTPPVAAVLASLGLLLHLEDG